MGNTSTNLRKFVAPCESMEAWEQYSQSEWRSERSRDLDKFGGQLRPAIARGKSMTAKLQFLEDQCRQQGEEITRTVDKSKAHPHALKHQESPHMKGRSSRSASVADDPSQEQRQKQEQQAAAQLGHWRERVHGARRRVLWMVWVSILFERKLRAKRRLRRVDSMSYYINAVLDADVKRFLAQQQKCAEALEAGKKAGGGKFDFFKPQPPPLPAGTPFTGTTDAPSPRSSIGGASRKVRSESTSLQPSRKVSESSGAQVSTEASGASLVPDLGLESTSEAPAPEGSVAPPEAVAQPPEGSAAPENQAQAVAQTRTPVPPTVPAPPAGLRPLTPPIASPFSPMSGTPLPHSQPGSPHWADLEPDSPQSCPNIAYASLQPSSQPSLRSSLGSEGLSPAKDAPRMTRKSSDGGGLPKSARATHCGAGGTDHRTVPSRFGYTPAYLRSLAPTVLKKQLLGDGKEVDACLASPLAGRRQLSSELHRVSFLPPVVGADYSKAVVTADPVASAPEPVAKPTLPPLELERSSKSSPFLGDRSSAPSASTAAKPARGSHFKKALTLSQHEAETPPAVTLVKRGLSMSGLPSLKARQKKRQQEEEEDLEADMANFAKQFQEAQALAREQAQAATRHAYQDSLRLLSMYVNRGNSSWASTREWTAPTMLSRLDQDTLKASPDHSIHQATCIQALKRGSVAVQLIASDDPMLVADGTAYDLWTSDPWDLIYHKQSDRPPECMLGVPLGCRALINLALAAEALGGKPAVSALVVLLHLPEQHAEKALQQLCTYKFCGLQPSNIWVMTQRHRHGYRYDPAQQRFVVSEQTPLRSPGSGLAMMQTNWVGEAVCLDREGAMKRLQGTVVEQLDAQGVAWMVSYSGNDLGLFSRESCLDLLLMSFTMMAHANGAAHATLQAIRSDCLGSVLSVGDSATGRAPSVVLGRADQAPSNRRGVMALQGMVPVAELRGSELQSGTMKDVLSGSKLPGGYLLGLNRYFWHLDMLRGLLTSPASFRPKLRLLQASMHVCMDAGDLVAADASRTLCLEAKPSAKLLLGHEDFRDLLPLLRAQEAFLPFRSMAVQKGFIKLRPGVGMRSVTSSSGVPGPRSPAGGGASYNAFAGQQADEPSSALQDVSLAYGKQPAGGRRRVVVFVTSNSISASAVDVALQFSRPGRDTVLLATVVSGLSHVEFGQTLLAQYTPQVAAALVDCQQDVLPMLGEHAQMISTMADFIDQARADLVVMASRALSATTLHSSSILGSVTLAAVKRIAVPLLIINANSVAATANTKRGPVKALVVAQRNSTDVLRFMCNSMLQAPRGDQLILGQIQSSNLAPGGGDSSHLKAAARLLASYTQAAVSQGLCPPVLTPMAGDQLSDVLATINTEAVHVMAYPLPHTVQHIPEQLVHLIHSARCGVLVYRNAQV